MKMRKIRIFFLPFVVAVNVMLKLTYTCGSACFVVLACQFNTMGHEVCFHKIYGVLSIFVAFQFLFQSFSLGV